MLLKLPPKGSSTLEPLPYRGYHMLDSEPPEKITASRRFRTPSGKMFTYAS
jgi:hypothetical protein